MCGKQPAADVAFKINFLKKITGSGLVFFPHSCSRAEMLLLQSLRGELLLLLLLLLRLHLLVCIHSVHQAHGHTNARRFHRDAEIISDQPGSQAGGFHVESVS